MVLCFFFAVTIIHDPIPMKLHCICRFDSHMSFLRRTSSALIHGNLACKDQEGPCSDFGDAQTTTVNEEFCSYVDTTQYVLAR
jgi:hypothetical protein